MNVFRPGMTRILTETPVPVVPMAISGLLGLDVFARGKSHLATACRADSSRVIVVTAGAGSGPVFAEPAAMRETV